MSATEKTGYIIEKAELLSRLNNGEIFKTGTWTEENLRYVGYDLRIAKDFLIIPKSKKNKNLEKLKFNKKDNYPYGTYNLKPGETIFVSSLEKINMPWDMYGNIGTKFELLSQGILTYTGLMIEAGYGFKPNIKPENKIEWEAIEDERIHFFLTNLGAEPFPIKFGETKIATVQFFKINEIKEDERNLTKYKGNDFVKKMFEENTFNNGVVFLKDLKDQYNIVTSETKENKTKIDNFGILINKIDSSTNQIVVFGIFLISITLLGVVFSYFIANFKAINEILSNELNIYSVIILIIFLFLLITSTVYPIYRFNKNSLNYERNRNSSNDKNQSNSSIKK